MDIECQNIRREDLHLVIDTGALLDLLQERRPLEVSAGGHPRDPVSCAVPAGRDCLRRVLARWGHDVGWIIDAELNGSMSEVEAAALIWCSVTRVIAGLPVVKGWYGPWCEVSTGGILPTHQLYERRFPLSLGSLPRPRVQGPRKQVQAAMARRDAEALAEGYALKNADALLLPISATRAGQLDLTP